MHLKFLAEIPEDSKLRQDWNVLVQHMERPEVFYTYEWALAMQRAYGATLTPFLGLAYEEGALVGVAALATDGARREVRFLSSTTADYCDFLSAPCRREALIRAVLNELRCKRIDRMVFANLPADSASSGILKTAASTTGFHTFSRLAYQCAQVSFASQSERDACKSALFGKKIRRYLNTLQREGPVTISHLRHFGEIEETLPQFSKAHIARFLATNRISILVRPERRLFLRELAGLLSRSGSLVLTRLMVGERPVAWNYGFQFAGSWFWYQPTFDTRLEQYSPGICLLSKVISAACDDSEMHRVDLGLGAEGYKERFANGTRETLHVTLTKSALRHATEVVRYRAAVVVKTLPRAEELICLARNALKERARHVRQPGAAASLARRVRTNYYASQEIAFYEWPVEAPHLRTEVAQAGLALRPLDLELLAVAAMEYCDDEQTLRYLLRCADRLRSATSEGYALVRADEIPMHICWVCPFEDFHLRELGREFRLPLSPEVFFLIDPWTPLSLRGRGFALRASQMIGDRLCRRNRTLWIVARSRDAMQKLEESGFQRRYSILRRRLLWYQRVEIQEDPESIAMEVPVAS